MNIKSRNLKNKNNNNINKQTKYHYNHITKDLNHITKHHNHITKLHNNYMDKLHNNHMGKKFILLLTMLMITQDMIIKYKFHINSNFSSNRTFRCYNLRCLIYNQMCSYLVCRNKSKSLSFKVTNFFKLMQILLLRLKLCKNLRKLEITYLMTAKRLDIYLLECILRLLKV